MSCFCHLFQSMTLFAYYSSKARQTGIFLPFHHRLLPLDPAATPKACWRSQKSMRRERGIQKEDRCIQWLSLCKYLACAMQCKKFIVIQANILFLLSHSLKEQCLTELNRCYIFTDVNVLNILMNCVTFNKINIKILNISDIYLDFWYRSIAQWNQSFPPFHHLLDAKEGKSLPFPSQVNGMLHCGGFVAPEKCSFPITFSAWWRTILLDAIAVLVLHSLIAGSRDPLFTIHNTVSVGTELRLENFRSVCFCFMLFVLCSWTEKKHVWDAVHTSHVLLFWFAVNTENRDATQPHFSQSSAKCAYSSVGCMSQVSSVQGMYGKAAKGKLISLWGGGAGDAKLWAEKHGRSNFRLMLGFPSASFHILTPNLNWEVSLKDMNGTRTWRDICRPLTQASLHLRIKGSITSKWKLELHLTENVSRKHIQPVPCIE